MTTNIQELRASFEKIRPWLSLRSMEERLDELISKLEEGKRPPPVSKTLLNDDEIDIPF